MPAADSVQDDLAALRAQHDDAIEFWQSEVNNAMYAWQGSTNPNMVAPNSQRAHAERVRKATIDLAVKDAKGDLGLGGAGLVTSTISAAGAITAFIVGAPATGTILALVSIGITVHSLITSADDLQNAVSTANQLYAQNPARLMFLDTIAFANSVLAATCDQIQQALNSLIDAFEDTRDSLFQQCLLDLDLELEP